nr:MAG: nonstructural protein 1 [Canine parvovirus]
MLLAMRAASYLARAQRAPRSGRELSQRMANSIQDGVLVVVLESYNKLQKAEPEKEIRHRKCVMGSASPEGEGRGGYIRGGHVLEAPFRRRARLGECTMIGGVSAELKDFCSFCEPAYTFILRLPWKNWKAIEGTIQSALTEKPLQDILVPANFGNMPSGEDIEALEEFLQEKGPQRHYCRTIAAIAHEAVEREFMSKQATSRPKYSCYVQVELTDSIHVHLVIGGMGINKYNAKAWRNTLAYRFFGFIITYMKNVLGSDYTGLQYEVVTQPVEWAVQECVSRYTKYCTILQYKSRNGQMYACKVNPREFITNYLLPKNLRFNQYIDPNKQTPIEAHFLESNKTYAYTCMDRKYVDPSYRKILQRALYEETSGSREPRYSGDPYGELPEVAQAAWTQSSQPSGHMTKREGLMLDCMKRCFDGNILTYEQLVDAHPELVIMIESQTGGSRLLEQILQMTHIKIVQQFTALEYIKRQYPETELQMENKVFQLLNIQGYNGWQVGHWLCCVLNKHSGKQNSVCFYGPASTGKTNLAKAIVNAVKLYGCVNHLNRNFVFNDCAAKLVIWWEECLMHSDWVEQAKCCMGGTEFRIDRKHKESQLLPRTPLIISTNNVIYETIGGNHVSQVHAKPIKDRTVQFNFMKLLPSTFGEITPKEVADWLMDCMARFDCTLEGFYREWDCEEVPNQFPLANYCDSHTQNFVLDERGLCLQCGGYLPLSDGADDSGASPASDTPGIDDLLSTPARNGTLDLWTDGFDLSLLATPTGVGAREGEPASSSTCAEEPKRKRKRLDFDTPEKPTVSQLLDEFNTQPRDEYEWQRYEEIRHQVLGSAKPAEPEKEPEPLQVTPTQWGELLGVVEREISRGEEPIVLHCFESLTDSDVEEAMQK